MVGKTALNKEMKHLNGAYFRTINNNCATSKSPLLIVQHPFHELKQDV